MATYNSNAINPNNYVYSDLNARLPYVSPEDYTIVTDREAILQSIYRLLHTQEGEIPNYRGYGMDLKQFLQAPLNDLLKSSIKSYVTDKITTYEPRVSLEKVDATIDYNNSAVILQYYLKIKTTDEIIKLQPVTIYV